jgi:hypothetical protein
VALFPNIAPLTRDLAIASLGTGCNHLIGEQLIAVVLPCQGLDDSFAGGMVTDDLLRWVGTTTERKFFSIKWRDLRSVHVKKNLLLGPEVSVQFLDGAAMSLPQVYEDVIGLGAEVARVPPEHRAIAPQPLAQPTAQDPAGAHGALANAIARDPRHEILQHLLVAQVRAGAISIADAPLLAARASLLHRNAFLGRGSPQPGSFLCPLGPADAVAALARTLGAPFRQASSKDGTIHYFSVPLPMLQRVAPTPGSVVVVGSSTYTRHRMGIAKWVTELVVEVAPLDGMSRLLIGEPLSRDNPSLLALILQQLSQSEGLVLLLRVLFGASPSPADLSVVNPAETSARARALLGNVDLQPFGVFA